MERRAAVEYLLNIAEQTDNPKFSVIVNDLARRVALSFEQKDVNLERYCSKMAAELMFRDDYTNANKLMKIAQEAKTDPNEILPLNKDNESDKVINLEEQPQNSNTNFIAENLPPTKPIMPLLNENELGKFLENLGKAGVTITTQEQEEQKEQAPKDQDDSKNSPNQMEADPNFPLDNNQGSFEA